MVSRVRPILTALGVLVAAGALRMPIEQSLTTDFRRQGLLEQPLEIDTKEKIGQNSLVVALAGLRTLVAAFTHLQATEKFTKTQWAELEDLSETTVRLAPRTSYYWDIGGWHLGYNASASFRSDKGLPQLRAQAEARRWVEKGREFFDRGARNLPKDWKLPAALGNLYSDPHRFPDDTKAEEAFARAIATGNAPAAVSRARLIAAARAGKDPAQTLAEIRKMLEEPSNRLPTLLCLEFVLENKLSPQADPLAHAVKIFGSEAKALRNLGAYSTNILDRLPEDGVDLAIRLLESHADIPPDDPRSFILQRERLLDQDRFTQ